MEGGLNPARASAPLLCCRLRLLRPPAFLVLLLKSFNTSRRIHQLLLACIERMAVGADFHADVAFVGRAGLERVATSADHVQLIVSGVNTGLHLQQILSRFSVYQNGQTPVSAQTTTRTHGGLG